MSIRCGNCKESHETVSDVRSCFGQEAPSVALADVNPQATIPGLGITVEDAEVLKGGIVGWPDDGRDWPVSSSPSPAEPSPIDWDEVRHQINWEISENHNAHTIGLVATTKQVDFAASLMDRRVHELKIAEGQEDAWRRSLPRRAMSILISALKEAPVKRGTTGEELPLDDRMHGRPGAIPPVAEVPAGRYAIDGADGSVKFYKVDRPTEGRWAGYTFVKIQAGSEYHRVPAQRSILAKIAEVGPEAAMLRYGRELGHCGHCGRELTNPESREIGIGPVCRSKVSF